jgi:hypothetical protein
LWSKHAWAKNGDLILKIGKAKGGGSMAPVVEHLLSNYEFLEFNPQYHQNNNNNNV